jgi:hypothetical protein
MTGGYCENPRDRGGEDQDVRWGRGEATDSVALVALIDFEAVGLEYAAEGTAKPVIGRRKSRAPVVGINRGADQSSLVSPSPSPWSESC